MLDGLKKYFLYISAIVGWIATVSFFGTDLPVDEETIKAFLGEAMSNQIAQFGFCFTAAAWMHSSRVKKEIKSNFTGLTNALNNVADSLRADLLSHSNKLDAHQNKIDTLSVKVQNIENNIKPKT